MKKLLITLLVFVSSFTLIACSTNTQQQNTGVGAVTGAVVGGLAGSLVGGGVGKVVAVGAGAVLGAVIGGSIGHSMDSSDSMKVSNTLNSNPTNHATYWRNPKTGATYKVVPISGPFTVHGNPDCRKYRTTAVIDGKTHHMYGVACRQANGRWVAVN